MMVLNVRSREWHALQALVEEVSGEVGCPGGPKPPAVWSRVKTAVHHLQALAPWSWTAREDLVDATWAEWVTIVWAAVLDGGSTVDTTALTLDLVRHVLLPNPAALTQKGLDLALAVAHAAPQTSLRRGILELLGASCHSITFVVLCVQDAAVEAVITDMLEDSVAAGDTVTLAALLNTLANFGYSDRLATDRRHKWLKGLVRVLGLFPDDVDVLVASMRVMASWVVSFEVKGSAGYVVTAVVRTLCRWVHMDHGAALRVWCSGAKVVCGHRGHLPKASVAAVLDVVRCADTDVDWDAPLFAAALKDGSLLALLGHQCVVGEAPVRVSTVLARLFTAACAAQDEEDGDSEVFDWRFLRLCRDVMYVLQDCVATSPAAAKPLCDTRFLPWAVRLLTYKLPVRLSLSGAVGVMPAAGAYQYVSHVLAFGDLVAIIAHSGTPLRELLDSDLACQATRLVSLRPRSHGDRYVGQEVFQIAVEHLVPLWVHDDTLATFAGPDCLPDATVQDLLRACKRWRPLRQEWCAAVFRGGRHLQLQRSRLPVGKRMRK